MSFCLAWRTPETVAMRILDSKIRQNLLHYLLQSLMAGTCIGIIFYLYGVVKHGILIAALGSTAFIVFTMPGYVTAQPRRVIGGHSVGIMAGLMGRYISTGGRENGGLVIGCILAVFLATFIMVISNTEHPPAAGTALGLAVTNWSDINNTQVILFTVGAVLLMSLIKRILKPWLRDLI